MSAQQASQLRIKNKITPPALRDSFVARKVIIDAITSNYLAKLIVVHAPAGFGKTTVMAQSMRKMAEQGAVTAWLTLDDADNDVASFLSHLSAAIPMPSKQASVDADSLVDSQNYSGDVALEIVSRVAQYSSRFVLFFDDFEYVTDPIVLGVIKDIVDNLPSQSQLVIGTRVLQEIGLAKYRAKGQLLEISTKQLRFSIEETSDFLVSRHKIDLSREYIEQIYERAEGWITAILLASLTLEGEYSPGVFVERLSGSNQSISDYLAQAVLDRQPNSVRRFLLYTSIVRDLNVSICNVLLPESSSEQILANLSKNHIFLTELDHKDKTYKYHSLFSEFLREKLHERYPNEVPELHLRASRWYEQNEQIVPAIAHAIEGRDYERAMSLLDSAAQTLLSKGRMRLLSQLLSKLPSGYRLRNPKVALAWIWALCLTAGPQVALDMLKKSGLDQSQAPSVYPHVIAIWTHIYLLMDEPAKAIEIGEPFLQKLPSAEPFADATLINSLANCYTMVGNYSKARELLDRVKLSRAYHNSHFNQIYAESVEGLIDLHEGRQRQAVVRFRLAVGASRQSRVSEITGNAWPGVFHAACFYESNDLETAKRLLKVYTPLVKEAGLPDHMLLSNIMLARIAQINGDLDDTFQILAELEQSGFARALPRVVSVARLELARVRLLQGKYDDAREELMRAANDNVADIIEAHHYPANDLQYHELASIRLELHTGDVDSALGRLEDQVTKAMNQRRFRRVLKLNVLKAIALHKKGNVQKAFSLFNEVLKTGSTEGYYRLILDEGAALKPLLSAFNNLVSEGKTKPDPAFSRYIKVLLAGLGADDPGANPELETGNIVEPLTPKEIQVLGFVAEGLSNSAIKDRIFVSESTVRTHLRNINSKLQASSRTQAVAVARKFGII